MEMRRKGARRISNERALLTAYWFFSGYGQRASRALVALIVAIGIFSALFHSYGFSNPARPFAPASARVAKSTTAHRASLFSPAGLAHAFDSLDAWTYSASTAAVVTTGPEAGLNATGRALRVALRVIGPALIALAVLAIRNQVRRRV
jgi:hypothetical protein